MSRDVRSWWWIGFTDDARPVGQRALGAIVVDGIDERNALSVAKAYGNVPTGSQVRACYGQIDESWGDPPGDIIGQLLNENDARELALSWDPGHRGLADADQIRKAFEDDDAQDGEPLFNEDP